MTEALLQRAEGMHLSPLDTSARPATFLVQLPNGRQFQISETAYRLLDSLATPKSIAQLAADLEQAGVRFSQAQLRRIVDEQLLPRQLLRTLDGSEQSAAAARGSLLNLHARRDLLSETRLAPVTRRLGALFWPPLAGLLLALIAATHALVYARSGGHLQSGSPLQTLPLVYALFLLSIVFHELGHLSACRRWSGAHGPLGVGLYFFTPVFFAEVSAAWRLPRWQRAVVDCAGVYFQQICTIPLALVYLQTGEPAALWTLLAIDATLLININPLAKYDGYWLLSDALGIPNLHQRMGELVSLSIVRAARRLGLSPKQRGASAFLQQMSRRVYLLLVGYTLVFLAAAGVFVATAAPAVQRFALGLPAQLQREGEQLAQALAGGERLTALGLLLLIVWNALVALSLALLLWRLLRALVRPRG